MPYPHVVTPRRDELLDVAQRLFARNGYDATSVSQIIAELGVSKGAFYHYFESKEDLVEALACRFAHATATQTDPLLDDPTLDAFSKLSTFLVTMRRHKIEKRIVLRRCSAMHGIEHVITHVWPRNAAAVEALAEAAERARAARIGSR